MRQHELLDEEDMMQKKREMSSEGGVAGQSDSEYSFRSATSLVSAEEVTTHDSLGSSAIQQHIRNMQNDEFDMDLGDIMLMEAIWLSIQENNNHQNLCSGDLLPSEHNTTDPSTTTTTPHSGGLTPSGGLACEHNETSGDSSNNAGWNLHDHDSSCEEHLNSRLMMARHQRERVAHRSNIAEAGSSYSGSEVLEEDMCHHISQDESSTDVPESFDEQMMLAMAISLAETELQKDVEGVSWH